MSQEAAAVFSSAAMEEPTREHDERFCQYCGKSVKSHHVDCPHCQTRQEGGLDKTTLLVLTFFFGWLGAHRFYTRKYLTGALYFLFFWTLIPAVAAFVEFIIFLFTDASQLRAKNPYVAPVALVAMIPAVLSFFFVSGILASMAVPRFLSHRVESCNDLASKGARDAYAASQAFFLKHPSDPVDMDGLRKYGFAAGEGVQVVIMSGYKDALLMKTSHEKGDSEYYVDYSGAISRRKLN